MISPRKYWKGRVKNLKASLIVTRWSSWGRLSKSTLEPLGQKPSISQFLSRKWWPFLFLNWAIQNGSSHKCASTPPSLKPNSDLDWVTRQDKPIACKGLNAFWVKFQGHLTKIHRVMTWDIMQVSNVNDLMKASECITTHLNDLLTKLELLQLDPMTLVTCHQVS